MDFIPSHSSSHGCVSGSTALEDDIGPVAGESQEEERRVGYACRSRWAAPESSSRDADVGEKSDYREEEQSGQRVEPYGRREITPQKGESGPGAATGQAGHSGEEL